MRGGRREAESKEETLRREAERNVRTSRRRKQHERYSPEFIKKKKVRDRKVKENLVWRRKNSFQNQGKVVASRLTFPKNPRSEGRRFMDRPVTYRCSNRGDRTPSGRKSWHLASPCKIVPSKECHVGERRRHQAKSPANREVTPVKTDDRPPSTKERPVSKPVHLSTNMWTRQTVDRLANTAVVTFTLGRPTEERACQLLHERFGGSLADYTGQVLSRNPPKFLIRFPSYYSLSVACFREVRLENYTYKTEQWTPGWNSVGDPPSAKNYSIRLFDMPFHHWNHENLKKMFSDYGEVMEMDPPDNTAKDLSKFKIILRTDSAGDIPSLVPLICEDGCWNVKIGDVFVPEKCSIAGPVIRKPPKEKSVNTPAALDTTPAGEGLHLEIHELLANLQAQPETQLPQQPEMQPAKRKRNEDSMGIAQSKNETPARAKNRKVNLVSSSSRCSGKLKNKMGMEKGEASRRELQGPDEEEEWSWEMGLNSFGEGLGSYTPPGH